MVALLLAGASFTLTSRATGATTHPFKADLVGAFVFGACPPGSPTGAMCLHDDVSGPISYLGRSSGAFEVIIDSAATGADGCAPISKQGSFVASNGDRLKVSALGRYCYATSAATYRYTFVGGTGRFAAATGTGTWLVPAPNHLNGTGGTGNETLRGTIAYPGPRGRLSFGRLGGTARHTNHGHLRVRVFSNNQGMHGVVVTVHAGTSHGRTLGRSSSLAVGHSRVASVRLHHPLAAGRYVAVAVGRDADGRRIGAAKYFGLRR